MKRLYGKLFLEAVQHKGSAALAQPDIATFDQMLQKQFAQKNGPHIIDENGRMVLLEGLVKESLSGGSFFNQSPDLLAPSLSAAMATTIEQLGRAGVEPAALAIKIKDSDLSDKPQVRLLIDLYGRYRKLLQQNRLTDPAGMRIYLRDRFDSAWFAKYRTIVIDGIHSLDRVETEIIRHVAGLAECLYIIEAPSSALIEQAHEFHPLRIIRDFLSALDTVPSRPAETANAADDYISTALFSAKSFEESANKAPEAASFAKELMVISALNSREEVSFIASEVKNSLKKRTAADSILVAFPGLDEYGPLVEEIFTDFGIPYNRALGRQLSTSPVAIALISLLESCRDDFSGPSLLRIFSSPFLKFGTQGHIASVLDRFLRKQRITGGRRKLISAFRHSSPDSSVDVLSGPLNDLFTALEPFSGSDAAPLTLWMERLSFLLSWAEVGARVQLIKGPLNTNLQAYRKLTDTLASLNQAGTLFDDYRYTFPEWLFLLKKTLMRNRFQVPPEDEGGVQVLGLEESTGHPWSEIYFGGLVEGVFPRRLPANIFLPEEMLETMGVRTLQRDRLNAALHFYRLLLSADRVVLTWPENQGERPVMPSPFLKELTPLHKAGLINRGMEKTSGIRSGLRMDTSRSLSELAKSVGVEAHGQRSGAAELRSEWLARLSSAMPGRTREIDVITAAYRAARPELKPGLSIRPAAMLHAKRDFPVTDLDLYLNCPYDYYLARVLGIAPLEDVTEDISPLDRGSKVHAILRNFYLSWGTDRPVSPEHRAEAQALLNDLADSAFDSEADTFRNRREKQLFVTVMAQRFLAAEEVFWAQGLTPAYLEQKIEHFEMVLSNGQAAAISAKIDRIDADEKGNFVIVDYKTGGYPLPKMNAEQDIFQLPVYAVLAGSLTRGPAEHRPLLRNPIGLAYYDLGGKTGAAARDVVLFNKEARDDHPSSKPKASSKTAAEFEAILQRSMNKARGAIEGILAGDFRPEPRDENSCRYCPYGMMCDKNEP